MSTPPLPSPTHANPNRERYCVRCCGNNAWDGVGRGEDDTRQLTHHPCHALTPPGMSAQQGDRVKRKLPLPFAKRPEPHAAASTPSPDQPTRTRPARGLRDHMRRLVGGGRDRREKHNYNHHPNMDTTTNRLDELNSLCPVQTSEHIHLQASTSLLFIRHSGGGRRRSNGASPSTTPATPPSRSAWWERKDRRAHTTNTYASSS